VRYHQLGLRDGVIAVGWLIHLGYTAMTARWFDRPQQVVQQQAALQLPQEVVQQQEPMAAIGSTATAHGVHTTRIDAVATGS
jgi:hypothetical protein